ncbi:MAG TPA: YceI family protein [Kofleriaceae bacterium]|nr:YceI family protein [Kofleriaceae bacterium]
MKMLNKLVLASVLTASGFAGSALAQAPAAPAAATTGDSIVVLARHAEAKPDDPVKVNFEKFKVTKASFDPKKIEGGKASIEIDATSLKTGIDKRDAHLNTPDFLDTAKYATIKIDIDGVKKKADKTYSANATVNFRGVTKKYPITFDVVDTTADSVHIKSEVKFKRTDFKVGKDSTDPKVAPVVNELVMQADLTLKKT